MIREATASDDELSAPLGQQPSKTRASWKLPAALPQVVAGALGLFVFAFAVWALLADEPLGGEPVAVIATAPGKVAKMPAVTSPGNIEAPRRIDIPDAPLTTQSVPAAAPGPAPGPVAMPGTQTVTMIDGSTGNRTEIAIPAPQDKRAPLEQRLLEMSRHGAIPRVGPNGQRALELYASATRAAAGQSGPKIAIVLTGLGTNPNTTQHAINRLPAAVTLAFSPYAPEVDRAAIRARADGHEILLQVPMEPFDYPDTDPGPQTLLTTLATELNVDRMHWFLSRIQGYVGIVNQMGGRFTAAEPALAPVLRETAKRGLIYLDDGSSPRSLASQIAGPAGLPFAKAEVVLDAAQGGAQMDKALARLEALAKQQGMAIGIASAQPGAIDRLAQWAKAPEGRGIVLVPISAAAIARAKSS